MSKTNTDTAEKEVLSPEQLEENRKKALAFYTKQTELLTAQAEYEKLMADIEQSRAKRMEMIIRQAQMAAGPETEDPDGNDQEEAKLNPKKRILKKD